MPKSQQGNRSHKSSVFTKLFGNPELLLELYSAISGKKYPKNTKIDIVTLSGVLYMEQLNDISFVIDGKLVVLIEHQSSVNENMPLRMLLYIAREYEKLTSKRDLYKEKRIDIPTPEFIVLYNGKKEFPDYAEMKLSDSYKLKNESCFLELAVKVYNINKGRNVGLAKKSPALMGYEEFISQINENLKTKSLKEAIRAAVKNCVSRNILAEFLTDNASEVENMLFGEWNMKDALAVRYEEGWEEGREELFALWKKGVSLAEAEKMLGFGKPSASGKRAKRR